MGRVHRLDGVGIALTTPTVIRDRRHTRVAPSRQLLLNHRQCRSPSPRSRIQFAVDAQTSQVRKRACAALHFPPSRSIARPLQVREHSVAPLAPRCVSDAALLPEEHLLVAQIEIAVELRQVSGNALVRVCRRMLQQRFARQTSEQFPVLLDKAVLELGPFLTSGQGDLDSRECQCHGSGCRTYRGPEFRVYRDQ